MDKTFEGESRNIFRGHGGGGREKQVRINQGGTMKIKDLPAITDLVGYKLMTKQGKGRRIVSGWGRGFWLQGDGERVYPVFFKDWDEVKEWRIKK
jgi:hypothetical protein